MVLSHSTTHDTTDFWAETSLSLNGCGRERIPDEHWGGAVVALLKLVVVGAIMHLHP
jgi:hypothetical protein